MAILRGGRRIGNYDIRLGFPRDKSLDNVGNDPRIGQKAGPTGEPIVDTNEERITKAARGAKSANIQRGTDKTKGDKRKSTPGVETTIGRFQAFIAQGGGLARPTKYLCIFHLPKSLSPAVGSYDYDFDNTGVELTSNEMLRNIGAMCNKIEFPSRDINTADHITYGPRRQMPYAYSYPGTIECSFYADKYLRQRSFWEKWQNTIFDSNSHNMNYYDNYISTMDIYQLGADPKIVAGGNDKEGSVEIAEEITYAVRLYEVYPQVIGTVDLSYASANSVVNLPITLNFRNWRNLTLEGVEGVSRSASRYSTDKDLDIEEKTGEGDFIPTTMIKTISPLDLGTNMKPQIQTSSIFDKLPPELRRAGRDVLNQVKRELPIGRVTGGRVFPPFL